MANLEALMAKSIEVPLGSEDRDIADGFAAQAGRFAERIRRNTLAVLAVGRYLAWQGFKTDLAGADCWHPALRLAADVADLPVVGLGRLECLVLPSGTTEVDVPLEVSEDRLAYVVLKLADVPLTGKLLGFFVPQVERVNTLTLIQLGDMDEFIEHLYQLQPKVSFSEQLGELSNLGLQEFEKMLGFVKKLADSQVESVYQTAVETLERLATPRNVDPLAVFRDVELPGNTDENISSYKMKFVFFEISDENTGFRDSIMQEKYIPLWLVIKQINKQNDEVGLNIQVSSFMNDSLLPKNISLEIFSKNSQLGETVTSKPGNIRIQREFDIRKNVSLTIKLTLDSLVQNIPHIT
jgi:Protein of unknown function (DUF1822)